MTVSFVREVHLKCRRPRRGRPFDVLNSPERAAAFARRILPDNVREHFIVLFLDSSNQVAAYYVAATGTAASCPVGTRELFQAAVLAGAVSIIAAHNHPSGNSTPSGEDRAVTRRLAEAGLLLGIPLLDHLVLGGNAHFSFRDAGELPVAPSSPSVP